MMGLSEHLDMSDLSEADRSQVIDLVERLRAKQVAQEDDAESFDADGEDVRAEIIADPVKAEAFKASIRDGIERANRGEYIELDEVFEELLAGLPE
jgi:predicted transcriptional regulator